MLITGELQDLSLVQRDLAVNLKCGLSDREEPQDNLFNHSSPLVTRSVLRRRGCRLALLHAEDQYGDY